MKEAEIVASFQRLFARQAPGLVQGIGDDCAVIRAGRATWLVTTDSQVEGVHFRREMTTPRRLGRKCLAVNLSDIAAMGGRPRYAFLSLGLPPDLPRVFLTSLRRGLREEAERYGVALAGGDTHRSPGGISLGLTVIGEAGPRIAYRSGARPGDGLFVSGFLGQAAAGLKLLTESNNRAGGLSPAYRRELVAAHQCPRPQVELGQFLVRRGYARAMIDLSDGLASDLGHLCRAGGVGARVYTESLPLSPALRAAAPLWGSSPEEMALQGGEDYQLLLAVSPVHQESLPAQVKHHFGLVLSRIGEIIPQKRVLLKTFGRTRRLRFRGYDHFAAQA